MAFLLPDTLSFVAGVYNLVSQTEVSRWLMCALSAQQEMGRLHECGLAKAELGKWEGPSKADREQARCGF